MAEKPRTLFEKIWDDHVVASESGAPAILAIDLHLVHEVTSPQAFTGLRERGLKVRKPGQTVATADHSIPTLDPSIPSPTSWPPNSSARSRRTAASSGSRSTAGALRRAASSTSSGRSSA